VLECRALDRELSEAGYLGDLETLDRWSESWRATGRVHQRGATAGRWRLGDARKLAPLRSSGEFADDSIASARSCGARQAPALREAFRGGGILFAQGSFARAPQFMP